MTRTAPDLLDLAPESQLADGSTIRVVIKRQAERGCARAWSAALGTTFARWGASAPGDLGGLGAGRDEHCAPVAEYRALSAVASTLVPTPLALSRCGDVVIGHTSWIEHGGSLVHGANVDEPLVETLLDTIQRAHWAGWVHGDIKPENIVLSHDGSPIIVDWGAARPVGARALPGTLGYAPPWAWANAYSAARRNDYYSLAVVLWESIFGRRAMSDDRTSSIAEQSTFSFETPSALPGRLSELFDVARRGGEGIRRIRLGRAGSLSLARMDAIGVNSLRRVTDAYAPSAEALGGGTKDARCKLDLPIAAADCRLATRAIVDYLRIDRHCNAMLWTNVTAALRHDAPNDPTCAASRADGIRQGREAAISAAARYLHDTQCDAVVWDATDLDEGAEPLWSAICRELESHASKSTRRPTLVEVRSAYSSDSLQGRTSVIDLVSDCFCTQALSELLRVSASRVAFASVVEALAQIKQSDDRGTFRSDGDSIDGVFWPSERDEVDASERTQEGARQELPPNALLERGEWAAAEGRLDIAIRVCVRLHTHSVAGGELDDEEIIRLADLWAECGRCDASSDVLAQVRLPTYASEIRLAKNALQFGDSRAAASALGRASRLPMGIGGEVELGRLSALVQVAAGNTTGAYETLRALRRRADGAGGDTRLWLYTTIGNVLRMNGRDRTARRVLKWVAGQAARGGSPRLQIAAASNLIIAQAAAESGDNSAQQAWALANRCFGLGMVAEGAVNTLTACTTLIMTGRPDQAMLLVDNVVASGRTRHMSRSAIAARLERLRLAARDMCEAWGNGFGQELEAAEVVPADPSMALHMQALRVELGVITIREFEHYAGGSSCPRAWRWLRVLVRVAQRRRSNRGFPIVAMLSFSRTLDPWLPASTHVARILVRSCQDGERLGLLLAAGRRSASSGEAAAQIAVSLHVIALAWRADVDDESTEWTNSTSGVDERRRPAGCRLWEWRAAMARAGAARETVPETVAERVLLALESTARRLGPGGGERYLQSGALRAVLELNGLDASPVTARIDDSTIAIERVRASLFRRACVPGVGSSRAQGLERVLSGALRLRSAIAEDALLDEIATGVRAVCRAERAVLVYDPRGGDRQARVATEAGARPADADHAEVSLTAVTMALRENRAIRVDDACDDQCFGERPSVMQYRPRSLIVAPLRTLGAAIGYVYVETRSAAKSFSQSDVELVEGFAAQAVLALENARLVGQLRRSCEELERARAEAVREENLRALGRMASEVAHEFNNLLTGIIGETQLMKETPEGQAHSAALSIIERAALDAGNVIARIRDTAQGRRAAVRAKVSLRDTAMEVIDLLRWKAVSDRIQVSVECDRGITVHAVPGELREVITNVVVNAFDAMPHGGVLRIAGREVDGRAILEIQDTGCGMSEEVCRRVFEPFFTTKGERGTGLGLCIAREIMARHGGELRVGSVVGMGTTISLVLPQAEAWQDGLGSRPAIRHDLGNGEGAVLVVDGDSRISQGISSMLEQAGIEALQAWSSDAAVQVLEAMPNRIATILTDVDMPGSSGFALAELIRRRGWNHQVVFMSADPAPVEATASLAGESRVLRKPFTLSALLRAIGRSNVEAS